MPQNRIIYEPILRVMEEVIEIHYHEVEIGVDDDAGTWESKQ